MVMKPIGRCLLGKAVENRNSLLLVPDATQCRLTKAPVALVIRPVNREDRSDVQVGTERMTAWRHVSCAPVQLAKPVKHLVCWFGCRGEAFDTVARHNPCGRLGCGNRILQLRHRTL